MIAKLPARIEDEGLRCPPGVQEPGELSPRIPDDRKRVPVLLRMGADLLDRLRPVAVDGDEENPLRSIRGDQVTQSVVVVVGVRTERRPEDQDDRAMAALRLGRRKRVSLDGHRGESGGDVSDLEAGRAPGEEQREKREGEGVADEIYSVEVPADADLRAKLRITRWGEKPQFNPTASPGWTAWTLLPHTIVWYAAKTSTVPVRA